MASPHVTAQHATRTPYRSQGPLRSIFKDENHESNNTDGYFSAPTQQRWSVMDVALMRYPSRYAGTQREQTLSYGLNVSPLSYLLLVRVIRAGDCLAALLPIALIAIRLMAHDIFPKLACANLAPIPGWSLHTPNPGLSQPCTQRGYPARGH
ncbi:hypothetical protein K458DRAFT_420456 [Lentithecium fluviatile CBS 122367]|uniref:Uncharacterized protein n=1 Tax=Lentithecium fluviatile CBS 122367 TaxID=1168545 RepID=A0A6G1ITV9_9PLEO|nr:hypothetical protein K458DRAFT_420456 [Lentithecium fluviatile CBS 122367]